MCIYIYIYIYIYGRLLLGIRPPGTTLWRGLSNHQAATAQMGTGQTELSPRIDKYRRVPTPLRSTSPFSEDRGPRQLDYITLYDITLYRIVYYNVIVYYIA